MTTDDTLRYKLASVKSSPNMLAIIGRLLGETWATVDGDDGSGIAITSDGFALLGGNVFLGSAHDLDRNLRGFLDAAELTQAERAAFWQLYADAVTDFRRNGSQVEDGAARLARAAAAAALPPLETLEAQGTQPQARLHLYLPGHGWHWYAAAWDGIDTCFGLVHGLETDLGYFSLAELGQLQDYGARIEIDEAWQPTPLDTVPDASDMPARRARPIAKMASDLADAIAASDDDMDNAARRDWEY